MKRNLVVGTWFSGVVMARLIAEQLEEQVIVIDKKDPIAGNCYDYRDKIGIMIHKYGSHAFHTNSEKVWQFVRRFTDFSQYMLKVIEIIDSIETFIPIDFNTLYDVFPATLAKKWKKKIKLC